MTRAKRSAITVFLIGLLVFLQYRLWFEPGGMLTMLHLRKEITKQSNENEFFKKNNEALLFQIQRLKESEDGTESRARNELGMIKKDEKFYEIVK
jgi:cell division protein FtsB